MVNGLSTNPELLPVIEEVQLGTSAGPFLPLGAPYWTDKTLSELCCDLSIFLPNSFFPLFFYRCHT